MTDPRVDAYIEAAQPFAQPILRHLRRLVHEAVPEVTETMKWSFPHFDYKGIFCAMAGFKAHCTFGFWKHRLLVERGLLAEPNGAMGSYGRLTSVDDLPAPATLVKTIRAAAALNDAGLKVARSARAPKRTVPTPRDLQAALRKSPKARIAFASLRPSHRREYVVWITEAKSAETRQRRLAKTIVQLSAGRSLNWKYERPKPRAARS